MVKILDFSESGLRVVKITGEPGPADLKKMKKALEAVESCSEIIIDLAGAHYIGSDFIRMLLQIRNAYPRHYTGIRLLNPNGAVRGMLDMMDITKLFTVGELSPTAW